MVAALPNPVSLRRLDLGATKRDQLAVILSLGLSSLDFLYIKIEKEEQLGREPLQFVHTLPVETLHLEYYCHLYLDQLTQLVLQGSIQVKTLILFCLS